MNILKKVYTILFVKKKQSQNEVAKSDTTEESLVVVKKKQWLLRSILSFFRKKNIVTDTSVLTPRQRVKRYNAIMEGQCGIPTTEKADEALGKKQNR
jgi:hypothetical protein